MKNSIKPTLLAQHSIPGWMRVALITFLILAAVLAVVMAAGLFTWRYLQNSDLIFPGLRVGSLDLSWLPKNDAIVLLDRTWNQEQGMTIQIGDLSWQTSPAFLGLSVDAQQTVEAARQVGRGETGLRDLIEGLQGKLVYQEPIVDFDPDFVRARLEAWSADINSSATDASLSLSNGKLLVLPAREGSRLDIERAIQEIAVAPLLTMQRGTVEMHLLPVSPQVADVSTEQADAQALLDRRLTVKAYDPISNTWHEWDAPEEMVASWVHVENAKEGYKIWIDRAQALEYALALESQLPGGQVFASMPDQASVDQALDSGTPIELQVRRLPTQYTSQPGETILSVAFKVGVPYWRILRANPGITDASLRNGLVIEIPSLNDLLPLPVVMGKRIVISISEQRLWAYENGEEVLNTVISTGISRSPTQPGVYQILTHDIKAYAENWDLWMPYFMGIYEAWPGFMNGIHELPILSGGGRLWANVLGQPASYGCIIVDLGEAAWLYEWAEDGVVVEIQR